MNYQATLGLSQSQSSMFQSSIYYDYALFLDQARSAVTARMFSQSNYSATVKNQVFQKEWVSVNIVSNKFRGLNFLKNPLTDNDPDRTLGYQSMTASQENRDVGMIVDLANWTSPGRINISNNDFREIQQYY